MPDLGWDIAETQLVHEKQENNDPHKTPPLQTLVTVIIMLITILEYMTTYTKEIMKKTVQTVKSTITKASHNELLQNIKDSYKTAMLAVAIATNMTGSYQPQQTSPHIQWKYAETSRHVKT